MHDTFYNLQGSSYLGYEKNVYANNRLEPGGGGT